jgi:hypothetical protein
MNAKVYRTSAEVATAEVKDDDRKIAESKAMISL